MAFLLLIGMALSAILTIVTGLLAYLGFIVRLADHPLQVLEPAEES